MIQPVSDIGSNAEENIAHAAKIIGRSKHRQLVFDAIYTGKQQVKSASELASKTGLSSKRVLEVGKVLVDDRLVKPTKVNKKTAYEKIDFFHRHKRKILSLVASPEKLRKFPTKRNPSSLGHIINVRIARDRAKTSQVTLNDIDSFRRARRKKGKGYLDNKLSESQFKNGLKRIIGEEGNFKDWGGETSDLFTTKLYLRGRRVSAALALKGPATKGKLTPGKMGKNGDQIMRLFEAPAELFLVQYCRQIDQSIAREMELQAVAKSVYTGNKIRYGIIDGQDSLRLVEAYRDAFGYSEGQG